MAYRAAAVPTLPQCARNQPRHVPAKRLCLLHAKTGPHTGHKVCTFQDDRRTPHPQILQSGGPAVAGHGVECNVHIVVFLHHLAQLGGPSELQTTWVHTLRHKALSRH